MYVHRFATFRQSLPSSMALRRSLRQRSAITDQACATPTLASQLSKQLASDAHDTMQPPALATEPSLPSSQASINSKTLHPQCQPKAKRAKTKKTSVKTTKKEEVAIVIPVQLRPVPPAINPEIPNFYSIPGQLTWGTLMKRPSKHIRSPYVGDATLPDDSEALVHVPGLEMGGLVVPGSRLRLLKKTGETKTGYSTELVFVDEPESGAARPALVAHNPLLANRLIKKALHDGIISELSHLKQYEIKAEAKITDSFRVDFAYRDPGDGMAIKALVEVKSVCLADYNPETCPDRSGAVFVNPVTPYQRHGNQALDQQAQVASLTDACQPSFPTDAQAKSLRDKRWSAPVLLNTSNI
eukprot:m.29531 g.29531  ORF g.29531 m.29531 type:complete len:355 (+) comp11953_c0_seq1:60-1124(+)